MHNNSLNSRFSNEKDMSKLLNDAVGELSKLPSVGRRTALRLALHLLHEEPEEVAALAEALVRFRRDVRFCARCNNLTDEEICPICANPARDRSTVCVVEQVGDVMSIENTRQYNGLYHGTKQNAYQQQYSIFHRS